MMENEERHASYAAAARSKSTLQTSESVLDSWEEAAQDDGRSQELEKSIEAKLDKMKQKQSGVKPVTSDQLNANAFDQPALGSSMHLQGESRSSADLTSAAQPPAPIRILKRPQSSGHLPQHGQKHAAEQSRPSVSAVQPAPSVPVKNGVGRSRQQPQQRTLEERAAAYAEARMRIFGVADQEIHDDLPVQPKLSIVSQSNQGSPSSNSNR